MSEPTKCATGCITPSVCYDGYCNRAPATPLPAPDPMDKVVGRVRHRAELHGKDAIADLDALIAAVRAETLREVRGKVEESETPPLTNLAPDALRVAFNDGWRAHTNAVLHSVLPALAHPEGTDPMEFTGLQATQPSGENAKIWVYREPEAE